MNFRFSFFRIADNVVNSFDGIGTYTYSLNNARFGILLTSQFFPCRSEQRFESEKPSTCSAYGFLLLAESLCTIFTRINQVVDRLRCGIGFYCTSHLLNFLSVYLYRGQTFLNHDIQPETARDSPSVGIDESNVRVCQIALKLREAVSGNPIRNLQC